jgi:integrase
LEITALRRAALEYDDIPSYAHVSPDRRDRWEECLSQRFGKLKNEIPKEDWKRANGWKIPDLIWTTLDGGLRPSETEQATLSWVNLEDGVSEVPREEEPNDSWTVGLRSQTVRGLENWLKERRQYDVYTDSDKLWLTQRGNQYQTGSLNYLLKQLCDIANIETQDRNATRLTLRETIAMHLSNESDSSFVREQLGYKSDRSTNRYESSLEKRKKTLEQIY